MSGNTETGDKAQIGLTPLGAQHLDAVMKTDWFATAQDAYRLAIAVAIAHEVVATPEQIAGSDTKYNFMGGVDRDGKVRALISALAPAEAATPARYAERLAHAGLAILASKLADEDALLSDALGFQRPADQPLASS
jgi:hypothetical protein